MSVSTVQKITFISCLVLCVSLFLPKIFLSGRKKEIIQPEVGPGHVPPLRYSQTFLENHDQWQEESLYTKPFDPEAISRITKGARNPNLLSQVIPVYGFGIFLYIIYIFFKLTHKDRSLRQECRLPISLPESTVQEKSDYEMAQLQARLRQMEGVKERRASKAVHPPVRSRRGSCRQEERKLRQLRQIRCVLMEELPLEGVSPEVEAEETPYSTDWEGYPEETFPKYEVAFRGRRYPSIILEEPDMDVPTAEELAERIGRAEEDNEEELEEGEDELDEEEEDLNGADEDKVYATRDNLIELKETKQAQDVEDEDDEESVEKKNEETEEAHEEEFIVDDRDSDHQKNQEEEEEEEVGEDQPCLPHNNTIIEAQSLNGAKKYRESPSSRRQITFSDHRHVFHYPKESMYKHENAKEDANADDYEEEEDDDDDDEEEEDDKEDDGDQNNVMEREEEDPLMEAERLGFHAEVECDPGEQEVDLLDFLLTYQSEATINSNQPVTPRAPVMGTLRMRHKKLNKKN